MLPPTHGLSARNERLVIASAARFRYAQMASRIFTVAAGVKERIAYNETPFPLSVIVFSLGSSSFAPNRESVPGVNSIIRTTITNASNGARFTLPAYGELWVSPIGAGSVYKVTEIRV